MLKVVVLLTEERGLYQPDKEVDISPQSIGLVYDDVYFETEDGETLNGWFVPAKDTKITILFCAGRGGNLSDRLQRIKFFNEMGLNIFTFDYRGFGNSSGKPGEQGLYRDVRAAYNYLVKRKDINKDKIVVYGKSLGGPVAADLCLHFKLSALILEAAFPSLKEYVGDIGGILPTEWLVSEKFDSLSRVKNIHIPKLFVQGMDDEIISFSEGRRIFNKAAPPKEFVPFDGHHDDNMFTVSDAYKEKIMKFLLNNNIL
ncbi:MAG: alpha/beta hydrolase [Candidatus Omnitrophica bacterium]|nr:alpha/beta hydrolase [Candidatus Omnitrophota bacterium]